MSKTEPCTDHYHCRTIVAPWCKLHRMACAKLGEVTSTLPCPRCGERGIDLENSKR